MKFGTHVDIGLDNIFRYGATEKIPLIVSNLLILLRLTQIYFSSIQSLPG